MGLALLVSVVFMGALGPGDLVLKEFYDLARALNQLVHGKRLGVVWGIPVQAWRFSACTGVVGVAGEERCHASYLTNVIIRGELGIRQEPGLVILGIANVGTEVIF
jgi:hypothetical protein